MKIGSWGYRTPGTDLSGSQTQKINISKSAYLAPPTGAGFLRAMAVSVTDPRLVSLGSVTENT